MEFRIVKVKAFKANNADHKHYSVAHKGRLFGVSTLRWADDIDRVKANEDNTKLTVSGDIEVMKHTSTDPTDGSTRTFLDIVPNTGLTLASF